MNSRLLKRTVCTLLMSLLLVVLCACSVTMPSPDDPTEDAKAFGYSGSGTATSLNDEIMGEVEKFLHVGVSDKEVEF